MISKFKANPCLCINLRSGAILVAALEIVLNLFLACIATFTLTNLAIIHANHDDAFMERLSYKIAEMYPELETNEPQTRTSPKFFFVILYLVISLTIFKCIAEIFCSTLLILGIKQERLRFLKFWLIFKAACIVLGIVTTLSNIVVGRDDENNLYELSNISTSIIGTYFFYVVYCLYGEWRAKSLNTQRIKRRGDKAPNEAA